jgi:small conductance mechanosensitive channel
MEINETIELTSQSILTQNPIITNIILALVIFFIGLIIGRIVSKIIERIFRDFGVDSVVKQRTGLQASFQKFISTLVAYVIYILFLIIALNKVGITHLLFNIAIIILTLVVIITIIFSLKDTIPNMVAYRTIKKRKAITVGDEIIFQTVEGKVIEINAAETLIQTEKKDIIHIPNIMFIKEPFIQKKLMSHKKNKKLSQFTKEKSSK